MINNRRCGLLKLVSLRNASHSFSNAKPDSHLAATLTAKKKAKQVFDMLMDGRIKPDVVTYNALIYGYILTGKVDEAASLFGDMKKIGLASCVWSYSIMINGYCKHKRLDEAVTLFKEMLQRNLVPSTVTYNSLIDGFCKSGRIPDVQNLLEDMYARGQPPNIITYNILLDGGLVLMPYTILIDGFYNHGRHKTAKEVFNLLHNKGWRDVKAIDAMINGLCKD
ncbi:hypothetical protein Ahy_A06g030195 isoform I [Arachis hypogaea]|uniref:Pentatricopeptide repeat-containing protein n=1 Tax=Arachis hypogaea TaxID=3818 RepID=A0A445CVH7_ARAHY|nr:hypothetical protein Ahy_A06g030195 isoform I [Arachis hypogaea]